MVRGPRVLRSHLELHSRSREIVRRIINPIVTAIVATALLSPFPATAEAARARSAFSSTTAKPTEFFGLGATGAPRPEFCEASSAECLVPFIGYDQLTGAIEGAQVNAGSLSFNFANGTGWAVSLAHFTGSVRGCSGAGTATIRYEVRLGAQPGKNVGTFTIVKGSGKAGLSGLFGTGSLTATPNPADGTVPAEGVVDLRCGDR